MRPAYLLAKPTTNIGPLSIGQVFRQDLYEESVLMKVINVAYNEEWGDLMIQARPPRENQIGDTIYTLTPEDIVACPIVERIYGTIDWCKPEMAHRIFEREVACGESLEIARRMAENQVAQRI